MRGCKLVSHAGAVAMAALIASLSSLAACGGDEASKSTGAAAPTPPAAAGGPSAPRVGRIDLGQVDAVLVFALDAAPNALFSFLGGALPTTPRLAELARDSVVMTDHVLASTGLNAELATLLTGRHSREHGVGSVQTLGRARLRASERTLAEAFTERGWRTLLAVAAPQLHPELSGFEQGFESIHVPATGESVRRADQVIGASLPTLKRWLSGGERLFALIELSDLEPAGDNLAPGEYGPRWLSEHLTPHAAGSPKIADALAKLARNPDAAASDLAQLLSRARGAPATRAWRAALRDGRASALDAELGRVLDALRESQRLERTLIVVVGTRGAVLEPPDESAGPRFLAEVLRTPLIVRFPGADAQRPRGTRSQLVSAVDLPCALSAWFDLGLAVTEFRRFEPGALAALFEGRADGSSGAAETPAALLASASLALHALLSGDLQVERVTGGEDFMFHRSGAAFTLTEPAPELSREQRARFERFAEPATLTVAAASLDAPPLEVAWRIERGLFASVEVTGLASEDLTTKRDAGRRRSGRARLTAGGGLVLGLTERTADVRLDLFATDGALPAASVGFDRPLAQSMVPRVLVPRVVPWPADDSDEAELALVDVQRVRGTTWRFAVNALGPCEALVSVWPPRECYERLEVEAGGRVVAEAVPGRLDVVRLVGEAPFDVTLLKGPDEQFAFAVRVGGDVIDASHVRVEGRRMASEGEVSVVVPGWLPEVTDGLYGATPVDVDGGGVLWRVGRADPAGEFGAEQALAPDIVGLVRTLRAGE